MKTVVTIGAQEKLLQVAKKLGLSTLQDMQGSTRLIYDTLDKPGSLSSDRGTLSFFENVGQRDYPRTNLDDNQFETNEALAVECIEIATFAEVDNTPTVGVFDQSVVLPLMSLYIANQRVLKEVPIALPANNDTGVTGLRKTARVWLDTPIVIPPQVRFKLVVENMPGNPEAGIIGYSALMYGTAALLNLKTSL